MIFNRVRFDRPGVVNLPRGSFLASRETIVQSRPSQSRSRRPPSEDYINSASRIPQVANWALASVCFFPDVLDRTTGMINAWNATCDHEKTIFSSHLCRTDFDGPCASSGGARRGAASKKHGRREEARMVASKLRVHAGTPKILWDPRGWPKWSAKWSVAILRRSRFFLFSFSVPTDFFDKSPRDFSR